MQLRLVLIQRPNGPFALKEPLEVGPDAGRSVSIPVDRKPAVLWFGIASFGNPRIKTNK